MFLFDFWIQLISESADLLLLFAAATVATAATSLFLPAMSFKSDNFPTRRPRSGGVPEMRVNVGYLGPENNIVQSPIVMGMSPGYSVKCIFFNISETLKSMGGVSKTIYEFPFIIVGDTDAKGINNPKRDPRFQLCVDAEKNAIHADVYITNKVPLTIKKGNAKWNYVRTRKENGEFIMKKAFFMPGMGINKCTIMNQNIGAFDIGVPTVFEFTIVPDAQLGVKTKKDPDSDGKEIGEDDESSSSSSSSALDAAKKNKLKFGKVKDTQADERDVNESVEPAGGEEVVWYKFEGKSAKLVPSQYSTVTEKNADIFDLMSKAIMNACYRGFTFDDETAQKMIEMRACFLLRLGGQQIFAPTPDDIKEDEESFYPGQFVIGYRMQNAPDEVECNEKGNEVVKEKIPYFRPNIHSTFVRRRFDREAGFEAMNKAHYNFIVLPPTNWNFKVLESLGIPYDDEGMVRSWWANMQNIDSIGRCTLPDKEAIIAANGPSVFSETIQVNLEDVYVSSYSLNRWCLRVPKECIIELMSDENFSTAWKPRKDRFKTPGDKGAVNSKMIAPALARSNVCCINSLNSDILGMKQTITDQETSFGILLPTWLMRRKNIKATPDELRKASSNGENPVQVAIKVCGLWKEYQEVMTEINVKGSSSSNTATGGKASGKKGAAHTSTSSEPSPLLKFVQKFFRILKEEKTPRTVNAEGKPIEPEPEPRILFFAYNLPEDEDSVKDNTTTFILKNKVPEFTHYRTYLAPKDMTDLSSAGENAEEDDKDDSGDATEQLPQESAPPPHTPDSKGSKKDKKRKRQEEDVEPTEEEKPAEGDNDGNVAMDEKTGEDDNE